MNRLWKWRKKQPDDSFKQLLTANAVKPATTNIEIVMTHIERGLRQWLFAQLKKDVDLLPDASLTEDFFNRSQDTILNGDLVPEIDSIQEIVLINAFFKDYDNSCLHSIASIQFAFQYLVKETDTFSFQCKAVNITRYGWQIDHVIKS